MSLYKGTANVKSHSWSSGDAARYRSFNGNEGANGNPSQQYTSKGDGLLGDVPLPHPALMADRKQPKRQPRRLDLNATHSRDGCGQALPPRPPASSSGRPTRDGLSALAAVPSSSLADGRLNRRCFLI